MYKKISDQIVTKDQLCAILTTWCTCTDVPTKNNKVVVAFPCVKEHAEITLHKKQIDTDYKGRLYKIEFFIH